MATQKPVLQNDVGRGRDAGPSGGAPGGGGSSLWPLLIFGLLGLGGYFYYRNRGQASLRDKVASAKSQIAGGQQGYNMDFGPEGFKPSGGGGANASGSGASARAEAFAAAEACRDLRSRIMALCDELEALATQHRKDDLVDEARRARKLISSSDMDALLGRADFGAYRRHAEEMVGILEGHLDRVRSAGAATREREGHGSDQPPVGDEDPKTLEEAYAVLNLKTNAVPEAVQKNYHALMKVWDVNDAAGDEDYKRREAKMKQLNAAKDFIVPKG